MINREQLGLLFANKRLKLNLTQASVAKRVHVNERTLRNWESGKAVPNLFDGLRCCKVLNINPMDLVNRY